MKKIKKFAENGKRNARLSLFSLLSKRRVPFLVGVPGVRVLSCRILLFCTIFSTSIGLRDLTELLEPRCHARGCVCAYCRPFHLGPAAPFAAECVG